MKKILSVILAIVMLISTFAVIPFTLQAATMPSCSGQKSSNVTTNSARVDFTIKNPSCLTIKTCGMQIRKKGSSSWTTKSETVTSSYQKKSSIPVWYTIGNGKEFNYTLSAGTTYEYRGFCKYGSNTYYTSVSTFTTTKSTTMPSCSGQKSSSVSTNSVRIDFTIKNPSCLTIKTCGMQIRKKGTSSWTTKSETVSSSYQKSSSIPVWYTVGKGKEFDYTLSAGTTYEYRGFCKYGSNTYYTSVSSFSTVKTTTMPSCSGQKSSNVTTNSARVDFTIKNPSCLTIKTCGMQIRKKGTSQWTTKSETIASSYQKSSSIPAWYTIGKGKEFNFTLSANTTYEYRGFCKYNNNTYYTPVGTFTTKKTETTTSSSSSYTTKYQAFIKDSRWKNNISWNGSQKPKLSTYNSYGCCAYVCDFCKYVYGYNSYESAKSTFTSVSSIKSGDILKMHNSEGTHWIVVLTRSGNKLYTAEGNASKKTAIGNSYYTISGNSIKSSRAGVGTYSLTKGYHMM
jgi:hypothetical protein